MCNKSAGQYFQTGHDNHTYYADKRRFTDRQTDRHGVNRQTACQSDILTLDNEKNRQKDKPYLGQTVSHTYIMDRQIHEHDQTSNRQ